MQNIKPLYLASSFFILMYAMFIYTDGVPVLFPVVLGILGITQLILAFDIVPTNRFVNLFEIMATVLIFSLFFETKIAGNFASFKSLSEVRLSLILLFLTPIVFLLELVIKNFRSPYFIWSIFLTTYSIFSVIEGVNAITLAKVIFTSFLALINLLLAFNLLHTNTKIGISQFLIATSVILFYFLSSGNEFIGNFFFVIIGFPTILVGVATLIAGLSQSISQKKSNNFTS